MKQSKYVKNKKTALAGVLVGIVCIVAIFSPKGPYGSILVAKSTIVIRNVEAQTYADIREPMQKEEVLSKKGLFTGYNSTFEQCGKDNGITASGKLAKENHTLACPPEYKFGTKIEIKEMGIYICEDRGGAIKGNHFDIYFGDKEKVAEARNFGKKNLDFWIVY